MIFTRAALFPSSPSQTLFARGREVNPPTSAASFRDLLHVLAINRLFRDTFAMETRTAIGAVEQRCVRQLLVSAKTREERRQGIEENGGSATFWCHVADCAVATTLVEEYPELFVGSYGPSRDDCRQHNLQPDND